jgi:hypothetical protein
MKKSTDGGLWSAFIVTGEAKYILDSQRREEDINAKNVEEVV